MPTAWLRRRDYGGLPTWRAAAGGCDLDVQMLGRVRRRLGGRRRRRGRWAWHVRRDGRDIAEGEAGDLEQAKRAAETAGAAAPLPEQQQLTERSR